MTDLIDKARELAATCTPRIRPIGGEGFFLAYLAPSTTIFRAKPRPSEKRRYRYAWDRQGRKGQMCTVLARGAMNSCLVEFGDGYRMITSRNALRKT